LDAPWLRQHNPKIDWHCDRLKSRLENHLDTIQSTIALDATPEVSKATVLPKEYNDFTDVFEKSILDRLPSHRQYDCTIDIEPGKQPPFGPIYPLSEPQSTVLREFIDENRAKKFISESTSPVDKRRY
jgi:hypothetical protein